MNEAVSLLGDWKIGPYAYQMWERDFDYLCQCVDLSTLETICQGEGDSPLEAVADALREALKVLL